MLETNKKEKMYSDVLQGAVKQVQNRADRWACGLLATTASADVGGRRWPSTHIFN